jgi:hypothetical protein
LHRVPLGAFVLQRFDQGAGWTETLSAIATVGATAAALLIATRDRSDRITDQLESDRAQAHLVLLEVDGPYLGEELPHFIVHVEDNGHQPILDVTLESAEYVYDLYRVGLVGMPGAVVSIVKPERALGRLVISFVASAPEVGKLAAGGEIDERGKYINPSISLSKIAATVQFTDDWTRRACEGLADVLAEPVCRTGGCHRSRVTSS